MINFAESKGSQLCNRKHHNQGGTYVTYFFMQYRYGSDGYFVKLSLLKFIAVDIYTITCIFFSKTVYMHY